MGRPRNSRPQLTRDSLGGGPSASVKVLLSTHSVSYAEGVQFALEAQGIKAILLDEQAPGYLGFAGRVRLAVAVDSDYDRAMEVVRALEAAATPSVVPASWRYQKRGCATVAVGGLVLLVGGAVASEGTRFVFYMVLIAAFLIMAAGVTMIILALRRDRPPPN